MARSQIIQYNSTSTHVPASQFHNAVGEPYSIFKRANAAFGAWKNNWNSYIIINYLNQKSSEYKHLQYVVVTQIPLLPQQHTYYHLWSCLQSGTRELLPINITRRLGLVRLPSYVHLR